MESQMPTFQDIVDRSEAIFSQANIVNYSVFKSPGDLIQINFPQQNALLDMNSIKVISRLVIKSANAGAQQLGAMYPSDLYGIQSIRLNGKEMVSQLQLTVNRNLMMNFLKYSLKDDNSNRIDMPLSNRSLKSGVGAGIAGVVPVQGLALIADNSLTNTFMDDEFLYNSFTDTSAGQNNRTLSTPSYTCYLKNLKEAAPFKQRFYSYAADTQGIITATPLGASAADSNVNRVAGELFTEFEFNLNDLCIELQNIPFLNLQNNKLEIQLRLNNAPNCLFGSLSCLSTGANNAQVLLSTANSDMTYKITDMIIYHRVFPIKSDKLEMAKQLYHLPNPYYSFVQDRIAITGYSINLRTNIPANKNVLAAFVFYTIANPSKQTALPPTPQYTNSAINYFLDQTDNVTIPYYRDSYYIPYNVAYTELNSRRYSQTDMNIESKQLNNYITSQIALQQIFANKQLNVDMNQFLLNRHCLIIPINSSLTDMDISATGNSQLANLHVEFNTAQTGFTRTLTTGIYEAHIFYLIVNSIVDGHRVENF